MNVNFKWVLYLLNDPDAMGNWVDIKTTYLLRSWSCCTPQNKVPKMTVKLPTELCWKASLSWQNLQISQLKAVVNHFFAKSIDMQTVWLTFSPRGVCYTNSNSNLLSSSFLDVLYFANMCCSSVRIALPSVLGESTMEVDRCYNAVRGWNEV